MPTPDDSDAIDRDQSDEPTVEPTVRELLLARIDEHCGCSASNSTKCARRPTSWHPRGPVPVGTPSRWRR